MSTLDFKDLYEMILSLKTIEDCEDLFSDLCTVKELENMQQRMVAARLLMENKTYNQVIEATGISAATLSRVSHCVKYGKGYKTFIKPTK